MDVLIKISTPADLSGAEALQHVMAQVLSVTTSAGEAGTQAGQKIAAAAQQAAHGLSEASHEADHFLETLKLGVGIDIGHHVVEGIAEIPRAFQEALAEGVKFNAQMETLGIQLGGAFRSADPGKYLDFSTARVAGEDALDKLRAKANELGTDFHALAETFAINVPVLAHAGIKDVQDQIDAITLLNQVAASKGIGGFQAQRDIIDILNGTGNRTLLGKELETQGISNESIKQAEQMGTLMDLLRDKLGAYGEAGRAAADTFTAAQQRLKNETEQLYGAISKPVFEALKDAYQTMTAEIAKPEVREQLASLGYDVASLVDAGAGLARWAVDNAGALTAMAEAVGLVSLAVASFKAAGIVGALGQRAAEWVEETLAVKADTEAIEENTAARAANAEAGNGSAVGAVASAAEAEVAAAGVTFGEAVSGVLQGAAALAIGAAIGSAIKNYYADREGQRDQQLGEESQTNSTRLNKLINNNESADSPEKKAKAQKDFEDELASKKQQLADLQRMEEAVDTLPEYYDPARAGKIADLKVYIALLQHAFDASKALAGTNPLADPHARKGADALAAYKGSPEYRLAQAQTAGDQNAIDDAQYDAQVDKRREHLEKTYGLNPDDAEQQAQTEVSAADQKKQDDEAAKEKEKDEAKAKRENDEAQKKAARDRDQAAAEAKQRLDAIQSEKEEIDIATAKANKQDDLARRLEKERDLRLEITRLQNEGLSYDEARGLALDKVNSANAEQDRADADRATRRHGDGVPDRTSYGYRDPDTGGALHTESLGASSQHTSSTTTDSDPTGGLHSGTLAGRPSSDRFKGVGNSAADALSAAPSAADALANAPSAADALGKAANYVPSFPTATSALGPVVGALNPQSSAGLPTGGGDNGLASAAQGANSAAQQTAQAAEQTASSTQAAASSLQGLASQFSAIKTQMDNVTAQMQAIQGTVDNLNSGG